MAFSDALTAQLRDAWHRANGGEDLTLELPALAAALAAESPDPWVLDGPGDWLGAILALHAWRLPGLELPLHALAPRSRAANLYRLWCTFGRARVPRFAWSWQVGGAAHLAASRDQHLGWSHPSCSRHITEFAALGPADPTCPSAIAAEMRALLCGEFLRMQADAGRPLARWVREAQPPTLCEDCARLQPAESWHLEGTSCPSEDVPGLENLAQFAAPVEGQPGRLQPRADKLMICPRCLCLYRVNWDCEPFVMDVSCERVTPAQADKLLDEPWLYML